jgi:hypothetical protein
MAAQSFAGLEAQLNTLDHATACRVAILVLECQASLELALIAVQEANCIEPSCAGDRQAHPRRRFAHVLDTWRSARHGANRTLLG